MHVNAVSLCHRVVVHMLMPAYARGFEFVLAKYFPTSCTLLLPLVPYPAVQYDPTMTGFGYEYTHDDGDCNPELSPTTVRLRPHPQELSSP